MKRKWFLTLSAFAIFGFSAPQVFASVPNGGGEGRLFKIPVRVTSNLFLPKYRENFNISFALPKISPPTVPSKLGLVLPSEIYKPSEKVKSESGFFSCGQSGDKELYARGVEAFNSRNYDKAEEYFERLLAEYPSSPYTLKAAYYLGYIEFKKGDYAKALQTFKNLCENPYSFPWKRYACYNAIISALKLGDYTTAESLSRDYPFWHSFVLWLEGKVSTDDLERNLNCDRLEEPYKGYCLYLKAYLNPTEGVEVPDVYKTSVELKKILSEAGSGKTLSSSEVEKYLNNPSLAGQLLSVYIYNLIEKGNYGEALRWLERLNSLDREKAIPLAIFLIERAPWLGDRVLSVVRNRNVAEVYAEMLYNGGDYRKVLRLAKEYDLPKLGALAAYQLGDYRLSLNFLSRLKGWDLIAYRLAAEDYLRLGDLEGLRKLLDEIKNRYPSFYRYYLGWYYYYKKDWAKAARYLTDPLYRATCYYNLGRYGDVLKALRGINNPPADILKAEAYMALGRFKSAVEALRGINSPDAYFLKGLAYFAQGRYREAAYYFNKVKNYPKALIWLANSYYNLGDYGRAERLYLEFIRRYPNSPLVSNAYLGLVNVYLNTGDRNLAKYLSGLVDRYPNLLSEEVEVKLAESFLKNGETAKAVKLARKLVRSKNPFVRGKALLILAATNPRNAPEYLSEAIKLRVPEVSPKALEELVRYYLSRGDRKKAEALLEKYGDIVSNPKELLNLYVAAGMFNKAYKLLEQLIAADNSYTTLAFEIARRYKQPRFYNLSLNSLDSKVATLSAYRLVDYYLQKGDLKDALKVALVLKVRKIRYEPYYSKIFARVIYALYSHGYVEDACKLVGEVNTAYLSPKEKVEVERVKKTCGR